MHRRSSPATCRTPVKYYNDDIKTAFKDVEDIACHTLLDKLPDDLRPAYEPIFFKDADDENDVYLWKLVKAADKLSALIKCMEETGSGKYRVLQCHGYDHEFRVTDG